MMYPEYFYLEQWYRWLRDIFPLIVIGLVIFMILLCCVGSMVSMLTEAKKEE